LDKFALLQDKLGNTVAKNVLLAPYTSFKIGGPAEYFYTARNPQSLIEAYKTAVSLGIRYFILGGGSNILVPDEGINGLVIKDESRETSVDGATITAQAGVLFDDLVDLATEYSLTGLEFAAGIPGTVGGAVFGNAGAFGSCVADILESAVIYNTDEGVRIVNRDYFEFDYRQSRLKIKPELTLSAGFKLSYGEKPVIADKANEHRQLRWQKHPVNEGSAGSVFKNIKKPELLPAGKLLEDAGARGLKVGRAEVFEKHCNIIVNRGEARAAEVRQLAEIMRKMVLEKFNISLEYEMIILKP
jgi:UDP-N-acetylmuramate dehydrogenase